MELMQRVYDKQFEGSIFAIDSITELFIEFYKTHNLQASSWVE